MRVAALQTTAGPDRDRNLDQVGRLVDEAAAGGARLVVLPEYFSVAGPPSYLRDHAERLDGPTRRWASELAARHQLHLVAGTFPERGADGNRVFNTSCLLGPTGALLATYRKIHLFDVDLPALAVHESAGIAPGHEPVIAPLGSGNGEPGCPVVLGLTICYDLRFPELYRILTLLGATVVAVPSAFTSRTGPAHWELLFRARAVEDQLFVVAAGQVGEPPRGMPPCHGHSMVVDPWGTVLAERNEPTPGVVLCDLDLDLQRRVRSELPVLAHRRPETYRWPDSTHAGGEP